MPSTTEKKILDIIDEYFKQSGKYPDPEELVHIVSVRLGKSISRAEAKRLIELHFRQWMLKKMEEEVAKYDFNKFYEAMTNVIKCTDAFFYETKHPKWGFRSVELQSMFWTLKDILIKEDLVDKIEAEAIEDEYQEFLRNPKPFSEICTPEDYNNEMAEIQHGLNMLTEYYRGMGVKIKAAAINMFYIPVVSIFRDIREDLYEQFGEFGYD